MLKLDRVIIPLKVLLVLLFAGLLVAEVLSVPGEFMETSREVRPEYAHIPWLMLTISIVVLVAVQVIVVCIWRLLDMVRADRIFSEQAFIWVDVIVWTVAAVWLLMLGVFGYIAAFIYFTPEIRDPGIPILLFGIGLATSVVLLLMVVMRALLAQAAALRADMEELI
jgi:Protein of unknown function (DUF2975)